MQAVILAAGASRRLRPFTDNSPKCLLDIGGSNLLGMTIENILSNGITEFIVVTGYLNHMIEDFVRKNFPGLNCSFILNSDYENNNNSYSLWMALKEINDSMLLLDSDILFEAGIIHELLNCGKANSLAVNFTQNLDDEQMKVITDGKGFVKNIGKELENSAAVGESIGIEIFSSYLVKDLHIILERKITKEKKVNEFYETSFQEIVDGGQDRNSIYAVDVSRYMCMEIDTPEDLSKAREIIKTK